MAKKNPKEEETVGNALIEIMREGFKNQDTMLTSINSKLDRLNILESLQKQNEEKLVKFEAALNLLGGIGRLTEQTTTIGSPTQTTIPEIENLPWRNYKRGNGSWIFADTQGAKKLYETIKESATGKIPIGDYEYKISQGKDAEFISRNPL